MGILSIRQVLLYCMVPRSLLIDLFFGMFYIYIHLSCVHLSCVLFVCVHGEVTEN